MCCGMPFGQRITRCSAGVAASGTQPSADSSAFAAVNSSASEPEAAGAFLAPPRRVRNMTIPSGAWAGKTLEA